MPPIKAIAGRMALTCLMTASCASCDAAGGGSVADAPSATSVQVVDELPLRRGFYVRSEDTCSAPSQATLALVGRTGVSGCDFTRIERFGESRYRVGLSCPVRAATPGHEHERDEFTNEYEILAEDRYRVTFEGGELADFAFCPQESMPAPWRDNDISDLTR